MNSHKKHSLYGFLIAVLVLTALFILLTKNALAITAYCFSLLSPIMFFGTLWLVASGTRNRYITNAAFPIQACYYSILNLLCSIIFTALDQTGTWSITVGWFSFIHIVLIALFAWLILAMSSGQEEIHDIEANIRQKTAAWKITHADVIALKNDTPLDCQKAVQDVADAIRYSDPVSCQELKYIEEEIYADILQLKTMIKEKKLESVSEVCQKIQRTIKDRNNRMKLLK